MNQELRLCRVYMKPKNHCSGGGKSGLSKKLGSGLGFRIWAGGFRVQGSVGDRYTEGESV